MRGLRTPKEFLVGSSYIGVIDMKTAGTEVHEYITSLSHI
jgi:hypothetical protein